MNRKVEHITQEVFRPTISSPFTEFYFTQKCCTTTFRNVFHGINFTMFDVVEIARYCQTKFASHFCTFLKSPITTELGSASYCIWSLVVSLILHNTSRQSYHITWNMNTTTILNGRFSFSNHCWTFAVTNLEEWIWNGSLCLFTFPN